MGESEGRETWEQVYKKTSETRQGTQEKREKRKNFDCTISFLVIFETDEIKEKNEREKTQKTFETTRKRKTREQKSKRKWS